MNLIQQRVEWYAEKAKDLVVVQTDLRSELFEMKSALSKARALNDKGKLASVKLGIIASLAKHRGHSKHFVVAATMAGTAFSILFRYHVPPKLVAALDACVLWLLRQVVSSGFAVARAVPPVIMLIQRAINIIQHLGSQVNAARIQNAVIQAGDLEQTGDNYAFMLTQFKGKRSAILYDPGCTAVMTN